MREAALTRTEIRNLSTFRRGQERFQVVNCPIISVDTKKKELIGNFKNAGRAWKERPEAVNAHDFPAPMP